MASEAARRRAGSHPGRALGRGYLLQKTGNPHYGEALVEAVASTFQHLAENPSLGHEHPRFKLHSFPIKRYMIFYRILNDAGGSIQIVRVLHQRRDHDKALRRWIRRG
jgi:plasmid stabilization system protein ParE